MWTRHQLDGLYMHEIEMVMNQAKMCSTQKFFSKNTKFIKGRLLKHTISEYT